MSENAERIAWVDYAKGICILLVVMFHAVTDYGADLGLHGWLHEVTHWAKPIRMPDFFLLSGLFLSRSLFGDALSYFDRKVVHFAYFYAIWLAIQTLMFEAGSLISDPLGVLNIYLQAWVIPKSSLWFVHMLAVFYIVTRLIRHVPPLAVLGVAAVLQCVFATGLIETGWSVTNRFAEYYVFFFAGYAVAPQIFAFADSIRNKTALVVIALMVWAVTNGLLVSTGLAMTPTISLALGFAGALAIVAMGVQLSKTKWANWVGYCGRNSIVIYLTSFIPVKILQKVFLQTGVIPDVGTATALILIIGVASSLAFHWIIRETALNFLYVRPEALRLKGKSPQRADSR